MNGWRDKYRDLPMNETYRKWYIVTSYNRHMGTSKISKQLKYRAFAFCKLVESFTSNTLHGIMYCWCLYTLIFPKLCSDGWMDPIIFSNSYLHSSHGIYVKYLFMNSLKYVKCIQRTMIELFKMSIACLFRLTLPNFLHCLVFNNH